MKNKIVSIIIMLAIVCLIIMPHTVYAVNNMDTMENEQNIAETVEQDGEAPLVQEVEVTIKKVNADGEFIIGAELQIINEQGIIVDEWISGESGEEEHKVMLKAGKYTLYEKNAPEGYLIAESIEFEVKVIITDTIIADVDWNDKPCNHKDNQTPMYKVIINGEEYEVYCINQGVATPEDVEYNGRILTPDEIRNFTMQETDIDKLDENGNRMYEINGSQLRTVTETIANYDVSDQTMENIDLYNKVLDIIYHRHLAAKDTRFSSLEEYEIRFITEYALKNYLDARITTYETERYLNGANVTNYQYNINGEIWQQGDGQKYIKYINKFYNREYIYDKNSPTGYVISRGNGDAFGNLAKHWYEKHGKMKVPEIYAELFYYLISEENQHPEDMQLYIYSEKVTTGDSIYYQNVLGITGYIDDVNLEEQKVIEMLDEYSNETTDVTVTKVWDDENNQDGIRPDSIDVTLSTGETYTLSEDNNWTVKVEDLPKYEKGNKIEYTWTENTPSGYALVGNITNEYATTLTNRHIPEVVELTIIKTWEYLDEVDNEKPTEITIYIYADKELVKTVIIKEKDNWKIQIPNLPKYKNGIEIEYSIREETPTDYNAIIEKESKLVFKIANYYKLGKGGDNILPPKTGIEYNYNINTLVMILSCILYTILRKRYI